MTPYIHLPESIRTDVEGKWTAFQSACDAAGLPVPASSDILSEIHQVFAFSQFVSKTCLQDPALLISLIDSGDLHERYPRNRYPTEVKAAVDGACDGSMLRQALQRIRLREMVRIAWRDLTGHADLVETITDLSDFADACIGQALSILYEWQCAEMGIPTSRSGVRQYLVVIGMGKLGGRELNFSSDIDLIFAYPEPGATSGDKSRSNEEFFFTLSRRLIQGLGGTSQTGSVFRVDMRLRPYGESGPIVMSFDNMIDYYQRQGREWERYAWIKARIVAGDRTAGDRLLERLGPFVYRRYLDYGAFDSLREMKQKITREVNRKGMRDNIKLGPGGIREVEFFGQIFQLIRGGVSSVLQERGIRRVLRILAEEAYIPDAVRDALDEAYVFLRYVEHRLQEASDQQVHVLPTDKTERIRLAMSLGFSDWQAFEDTLARHMQRVHMHFNELLIAKDARQTDISDGDQWMDVWLGAADSERCVQILSEEGYDEPKTVLRLLDRLREDPATRALSREGRTRLDQVVPLLLKEISGARASSQTVNRLLDLIKTVQRRTNYLALLLEHPEALGHLVKLANASPWIVSYVTQHPVVLDELLDPRTLYQPPEKSVLRAELKKRLELIPGPELEYQIEEMCVFKQVHTLHVAAADVTDVLPLMRVSDHLSYIAETIIDEVFELVWNDLVEKYGAPQCMLEGKPIDRGFAIVAYGKLGGLELGYDSDLDMVFLHSGDAGHTSGSGDSPENTQFFARVGQRVVHILTTHTAAGFLYETDMRLRPSGGSGPLVSHIDGFREYQMNDAWNWEHQALVRARAVCGHPELIRCFNIIRQEVLSKPREPDVLKKEVADMRERLRKQLLRADSNRFDLRQGKGGMVDIEFLVQYLVLLNAHRFVELTEWTDNVRQIHTLALTGVISDETAHLLKEAYLTYRFALHRLSLQEQPARVPDSKFRDLRKFVVDAWERFLEI